MSIHVMSHVWQYSRAKSGPLLVLLAIADYADECGVAYPSLSMLCFKSRMTERNVRYCLQQLTTRLQELKVEYGAGPHGRTRYTVLTAPNEREENFSSLKNLPGGKIFREEVGFPPGEEVGFLPPRKEKGSQKEITTKALKTPSVKTPPILLVRFEEFWHAYPKKKAKGAAYKAFQKIKPDAALLGRMLEALADQRTSADWVREGGQFIPYPATWLTQERWEDESAPAPTSGRRGYQLGDRLPDGGRKGAI